MDTGTPHNPFSSHLLDPTRGGYIFPPGKSLSQVIAALEAAGWRGELTGNHGAGKSTLLADICAHLRTRGHTVIWWQSSDRRRLPPRSWLRDIRSADVIAYDGAERLLPGLLLVLRTITRALGRGLIVTTHWRHGHGAVIPVKPNAHSLAQKFSQNLQPPSTRNHTNTSTQSSAVPKTPLHNLPPQSSAVNPPLHSRPPHSSAARSTPLPNTTSTLELTSDAWIKKISQSLAHHNGNSRHVLFDLYIEYEDTAQPRPPSTP